jgi:hypothetical protein
MDKTQLQLRIEASVRNNTSYPQNTYFIDLKGYRERPFSDEYGPRPELLTEDDIKTGETLEDITPAIQARLAHMDFGEVFVDYLSRYSCSNNFLFRKYGDIKIIAIQIRNNHLMNKARAKAIKRKGLSNLLAKNVFPTLIYHFVEQTNKS